MIPSSDIDEFWLLRAVYVLMNVRVNANYDTNSYVLKHTNNA